MVRETDQNNNKTLRSNAYSTKAVFNSASTAPCIGSRCLTIVGTWLPISVDWLTSADDCGGWLWYDCEKLDGPGFVWSWFSANPGVCRNCCGDWCGVTFKSVVLSLLFLMEDGDGVCCDNRRTRSRGVHRLNHLQAKILSVPNLWTLWKWRHELVDVSSLLDDLAMFSARPDVFSCKMRRICFIVNSSSQRGLTTFHENLQEFLTLRFSKVKCAHRIWLMKNVSMQRLICVKIADWYGWCVRTHWPFSTYV